MSFDTTTSRSTHFVTVVRAADREGVGPLVGILSFLILVGYFLLPQYVGKMHSSEGQTNPPVSGLTGFWIFLPYVGGFVHYRRHCEDVAAKGYEGFALSSGAG